jgi:predicted metal-dependent hydrolase
VLWNVGLFFELHELLETIWHGTQGIERTGLKGLIQAAGVYVHRQRENIDAASGLAQRARQNLLAGKDHLNFIANLAQLIECLADPSQPPPRLDSLER